MRHVRIIIATALIVGASYVFADRLDTTTLAMIAWKGAGVALLALWCAIQARSADGWMIAAVMAAGAAGDVLLEAMGLTAGALAFLAGHLIAIALYLRNRRAETSGSQKALALFVAAGTPAIAWLLTRDALVTLYALALGVMAATAWTSRFPRYRTGIGAMLFVASDLLIFARMGPLSASAWAGFAIWPLYFAGQALIAMGVVQTLAPSKASSAQRSDIDL